MILSKIQKAPGRTKLSSKPHWCVSKVECLWRSPWFAELTAIRVVDKNLEPPLVVAGRHHLTCNMIQTNYICYPTVSTPLQQLSSSAHLSCMHWRHHLPHGPRVSLSAWTTGIKTTQCKRTSGSPGLCGRAGLLWRSKWIGLKRGALTKHCYFERTLQEESK